MQSKEKENKQNNCGLPATSNTKKILVVDDSLTIRMQVKELLEDNGLQVLLAENGEMCLKVLEKENPDVILLDVIMPEMDGIEVCRKIKSDQALQEIPILILTTVSDVENKVKGLNAGADDYVTKPFEAVELIARVDSILRSKELFEQLKREIIKRRQIEDKLQKANESLWELNKLKDKFLGMAAHDMRNPLISIRGFSEILLTDDISPVSEEQRNFLTTIKDTSQEMLAMVNDLLDLSMIESGKLELEVKLAFLNKLVEKRVYLIQPLAKNKDIQFALEFSDIPKIRFDPKRIVQVIDNLVSNAIKFSPSGSRILITIKPVGQFVELAVRDEGPGIPEEDLPKLFGEFQRLSAQPTGGESSTGLGLSIAMKIAKAHQGAISVESKVGAGSTFTLSIPIERRGLKTDNNK